MGQAQDQENFRRSGALSLIYNILMTLEELLRCEVSKRHTTQIAGMCNKNPALLPKLWEIAISNEEPINWRAAWVMKGIWEQKPEVIAPYLSPMRKSLLQIKKDGVKREFLKMLSEEPLPDNEEELGYMLSACFEWLAEPTSAIAVKAHAMYILFGISKKIPEIIPELETTIELAMAEGSAGIVNRGSKLLKALRKRQRS